MANGNNGKVKTVPIDPANPPPGMFMLLIIDRLNEKGEIMTEVQGKIDEPYALECAWRGMEVLKLHHEKLKKDKPVDTENMRIITDGQ